LAPSRVIIDQFNASWTLGGDQDFNQEFEKVWGYGDINVMWGDEMLDGVKQATGLDVLTAALLLD
jgi:hypothetical protein